MSEEKSEEKSDEKSEERQKVSETTVAEVKKIAGDFGYKIDQTRTDFMEIINSPVVKDREDREELAIKMLKAKYASAFDRPTQEYDIYVMDITKPVTITKKSDNKKLTIGNILALAVNPQETDKKVRYAKIAHFDQNAPKVLTVESGAFYKARLSGGLDGNYLKLSAVDITSYQKQEEDVPGFENPNEVIRKVFQRVEIAEASMKVGATDLFLVEGQASSARIVPRREQEGSIGIYKIVDDSIVEDKELLEEMRGGMTVFVDEDQVKCGYLSTLMILGRFRMNEEFGIVQMNGELVIPIVPTPFERPEEDVEPSDTGLTDKNKEDIILGDDEL